MLRVRPRMSSPTRTVTLEVPISTAPMSLVLEITSLFWLGNGFMGRAARRLQRDGLLQLDRHLPAEREVDPL